MQAKSVEKHPFIIPGKYRGKWCAYYVEILFHNGNKSEPIKLDQGIRGMGIYDIIVDDEGWIHIY